MWTYYIGILIGVLLFFPVSGSAVKSEPVSARMAEQAAESFLRNHALTTIEKSPGVRTVSDILPLLADSTEPLAYVATLVPEGYVLIAGDTGITPIIGYAPKGTFPLRQNSDDNPLDLVIWDMQHRMRMLDERESGTDTLIAANSRAWEGIDTDTPRPPASTMGTVWGPFLTTAWDQGGYWNSFCPLDPQTWQRSLVGCVAIASAQVFNYWRYPASVELTGLDAYTSNGEHGLIDIPGDAATCDFPSFADISNALSSMQYAGNHTEEAYFCFAVGIKFRMNYASSNSVTSYQGYASFGYDGMEGAYNWPESETIVIENLRKCWPVIMSVSSPAKEYSHVVVVDGYDENTGYFHINMGWGASANLWYDLPDAGSYSVVDAIAYNLTPFATLDGSVQCAGQALGQVTVDISPGGYTTETDDSGQYHIATIPSGAYSVTFSKDGYTTVTSEDVAMTAADCYTLDAELTETAPLTLLSPNGGELLTAGYATEITWSSLGIEHLLVEYSVDHALSWTVVATVPAADGSYVWQVPEEPTTAGMIRLSGNGSIDVSEDVFTITDHDGGSAYIEVTAQGGTFNEATTPALAGIGLNDLSMQFPFGAVEEPTTIRLSIPAVTPEMNTVYSAVAFTAEDRDNPFPFDEPVTLWIPYPGEIVSEGQLTVKEWDTDAGSWATVEHAHTVQIDSIANRAGLQIEHTALYGVVPGASPVHVTESYEGIVMHPPYPNPGNAIITFQYELPRTLTVSLTIYDILGRQVAILESGTRGAGTHITTWNGTDSRRNVAGNGIYLYLFKAGSYVSQGKLLLLK